VFRIDWSNLLATRQRVRQPDKSVNTTKNQNFCSATFHPSLSSIALVFSSSEDYSRIDFHSAPLTCVALAMVTFEELLNVRDCARQLFECSHKLTEVEYKSDEGLHCDWIISDIENGSLQSDVPVLLSASFSNCGTSIYMLCPEADDDFSSRILISRVVAPPEPFRVLIAGTTSHLSESRSYLLSAQNGAVYLKMYEYGLLPGNAKLPYYQKIERKKKLGLITAYPEQWDRDYYHHRCWLLLGDDYDVKT
jgi:hypothetical protein